MMFQNMGTTRLILVCAVALLQVAASSGHLLHHALEEVEAEHHPCDAAATEHAHDTDAAHSDGCCANPPVPHECEAGFLCCGAPNADAVPGAQKQRAAVWGGTMCPFDRPAAAALPTGAMLRFTDTARTLQPTELHQITLPLLD